MITLSKLLIPQANVVNIRLLYILYLTSLGLVKGPKQTLWAAYNIKKIKLQAKNEKKVKKFLTLFFP